MRVIAGTLRGRSLRAPAGRSTRPTTDRVREALFSILGDLSGLRVLDLFAGSGAMGIEALSRGASWAGFVESDRRAATTLRGNLEQLGLESRAQVFQRKVPVVRRALAQLGPFDLVIADPPWPIADQAALDVAECVSGLISNNAAVVLGHPSKSPIELPGDSGLVLRERRSWGDSGLSLFEPEPPMGNGS